ncbi:MAG: hypothetical protein ABIQ30_02270 [Devosia sp.]
MILAHSLKTSLRAGIVALAIGGTALVGAVPAQAAPVQPTFGFSLNFGGNGPSGGGIRLKFGDQDYYDSCRTNSQIRSALRNKGYRDVQIVKEDNRNDKVWAVGRKNGNWYQLRVDRCSGKVDRVREIERRNNGNFTLNFTF